MSVCPSIECCPPNQFAYSLEPVIPPYYNAAQTANASCPMGYIGQPTSATVPAGLYDSYISQADADAKALASAQAQANLLLVCVPPVYWNVQQCATCTPPQTGEYCVPAGSYSSTVSQAAADSAALAAAQAALVCSSPIYWNTAQTATCPPPSTASYTVPANSYSSTVSQAAANATALAVATANLSCGIAGQLNGLRWNMPVITPGVNTGTCSDPADQTATLVGNPGQLYQVSLRFRGVVELKNYINGTVDNNALAWAYIPNTNPAFVSAGGAFQTGGIVDPAYNPGANEYSLVVSDPAQTYWLNRLAGGWTSQPVMLDYNETIPMRTGATVTIKARAKDGLELMNITYAPGPQYSQITVPGITNLLPNLGQFLQMDVISIA